MKNDKEMYPADWFIIFSAIVIVAIAAFLFHRTAKGETLPDCKPPACPYVETTNLGTGNLNVRSGAGTNSKVLGLVKQGVTLASRGEKQGNWFPVTWNTMQAFISADFAKCVDRMPDPAPIPAPSKYAWTVPSSKRVVQGFENPIKYQTCRFHTGIDIGAVRGADIVSMADGKVIHVGHLWLQSSASEPTCSNGKSSGSGRGPYSVVIDHGNGMYSTYGHNSRTTVKIGDQVASGQKIGEIGNLGYSCGPHLHLEVLENTKWTGNWRAPFVDACSKYKNPVNYK